MSSSGALPGHGDQLKTAGEFEDAVQELLTPEVDAGADDVVEPVLDE